MKKSTCKKVNNKHGTNGTEKGDQPRLTLSPDENLIARIPPDVATSLDRACKGGKWLIAIFHIDHDNLILDRTAMNFPVADIELASRLFVENVQRLK